MKKFLTILTIISFMIVTMTACGGTVDEPCEYCSQSPSVEYTRSDGTSIYVCNDCSSECMLCGREATQEYDSMLGFLFLCDDCYDGLSGK